MTEELVSEDNEQIAQRKQKLAQLRKKANPYPNHFHRDTLANACHQQYEQMDAATLENNVIAVKMAGRMMTCRIMGKASFAHLQDMSGRIQLYIARDNLPTGVYEAFKQWDLGDIIAVEGHLFKTKTEELSVKVNQLYLMSKALRPLPDKFHGLTDQEQRFRQRYLDLLMNRESRRVFDIRSQLVNGIRQFFDARGFSEVETPMMHPIHGGANAKPFCTHHNAMDMELFLRVAPELYLKRLVVGGYEKVFEINRNFRNEGISSRHNPEFTMLEFYQAFANYEDFMDLTEEMLRELAQKILSKMQCTYQNNLIDLSRPFERITLKQSILKWNPQIQASQLEDLEQAKHLAAQHNIKLLSSYGLGKIQMELFEALVERKLIQPTFITEHPAEVSPLARTKDADPFVTDRFELFIGGYEIANGFSELNDPDEQAKRFKAQIAAREAGDQEAMSFDEEYITALEYGLPPTAGEGIGIDRLCMFFADCASIRDVILFPLLRNK